MMSYSAGSLKHSGSGSAPPRWGRSAFACGVRRASLLRPARSALVPATRTSHHIRAVHPRIPASRPYASRIALEAPFPPPTSIRTNVSRETPHRFLLATLSPSAFPDVPSCVLDSLALCSAPLLPLAGSVRFSPPFWQEITSLRPGLAAPGPGRKLAMALSRHDAGASAQRAPSWENRWPVSAQTRDFLPKRGLLRRPC